MWRPSAVLAARYVNLGMGMGADDSEQTVPGYYGDVGSHELCEIACNQDPVCIGIAYAVPAGPWAAIAIGFGKVSVPLNVV